MFVVGNATTALMHLIAWTELHRIRVNQGWPVTRMGAEQTVLVNFSRHKNPAEGRFDFYVETPQKTIGFEVLTRPSKGKMIKKLSYGEEVDEFVFVLPKEALSVYKKTTSAPGKREWKVRPNFLPSVFGQAGLYVWLIDLEERRIIAKKPFSKIYNVKKSPASGSSSSRDVRRRR